MDNVKVIKAVLKDMPKEDQEKFKDVDLNNMSEVVSLITNDYPTLRNSFVSTLTNKVAKSMIFNKVYENPLVELKKGLLPLGDSIEELFVEMAEMKNFSDNYSNSDTVEGDLIKALAPKVKALYLTKNIDKSFKATVNDKALKKAFMSQGGLSRMIGQIVSSITNSINHNEFEFMKSTLFRCVDGLDYEGNIIVGKKKPAENKMCSIEIKDYESKPQNLVQQIRTITGKLKFMSEDYNMAKVKTFSNKKDLVLLTTPEVSANLDVNVLAYAFNTSATDIQTRVIEIDKLDIRGAKADAYTKTDDGIDSTIDTTNCSALPQGKTPLAILCDKDFLQIWDLDQGAGIFRNDDRRYTNHFANREYLMATCLFANSILFYA